MLMEQTPSLVIVSFAGFGVFAMSFFLLGLAQYRSKMPSFSHLCRDRSREAAKTPLTDVSECILEVE